MIQAVLFDFNGVIVDDEPLHKKAYAEALKAEGITQTDEEYFASLGMDDATFVRAAFERAGVEVTDERMRAVIEREAALHRQLLGDVMPLFPGVETFIKALARAYPLGVVSMADLSEIDYVLERAGLREAFSVIVSAENVKACKPDPSCYNCALGFLSKKPAGSRRVSRR